MKKIYILISSLLPFFANAQPTITQANLPVAGLVYIMGTDNTYSDSITPGGANYTWDYSSLVNAQPDTNGFMDAAGTPYTTSFPLANLSSYDALNDAWYYFSTDSTGFYVNGVAGPGSPTGGVIGYVPPQLYAPTPFTYLDTRANTSRIVVDTVATILIFTYNAKLVRNVQDFFEADGWGTLILPNMTYNNVLRAKITEVTRDSAYYDPLSNGNYVLAPSQVFTPTVSQNTIYRWVQNQQPAYLLGITADSAGTTGLYSEYLIGSAILSNNDLPSSQPTIATYPNPASHSISVSNNMKSSAVLIIHSSLGQVIEKRSVPGGKLVTIDIDNYSNGLYQVSLYSGSEKQNGRFIVQH